MGIPKITYNDNIIIDLTNDTVNSQTLLPGYTAHDGFGNVIYGEGFKPDRYTAINDMGEPFLGSCSYTLSGQTTFNSPVVIGDNVWCGCNVVILKGVKIGDNCVIAAGTVVNKDIPSNSMVYQERELVIKKINK